MRTRLKDGHDRIRHCVGQLSDEQVWWRPQSGMNSVANLLLHLAGNVRQWMIDGVTGTHNDRDRPQEFAERSAIPKGELLNRLDRTIAEADGIIAKMTDAQLLESRRIQGFDETVLSALMNSLTHYNGHAQEIIYITRMQLGPAYRFYWTPATPEQGVPTNVNHFTNTK
jgi:hypothetical protein